MAFDDDTNGVWYDDQGRPHITVRPLGTGNDNGIPSNNPLPIDQSTDPATGVSYPTAQSPYTAGLPVDKNSLVDILTGAGGGERYQLFPERIVRSALSLPGDVMSGKVRTPLNPPPVGSEEDYSADPFLQRVQDMTALMGGGGVAMAERDALGTAGSALKVGENEYNLFHGSNKPIESISDLQPSKSGEFGPGTYFSDNPDTAYMFGSRTGEEGSHIIPSVVKMEKPFTVTKQDWLKMTENKTPREIQAKLKKQGYDGIIGIGINGVDKQYIPFNNSQVRSSILKSDNEAAAPIAAAEKAPVFHSAVENAVNTSSLKSANPDQWLGTIANAKGVKPEELDWTGLKDWLGEQQGAVSKEQVQDFLQQNKVGLGEINKSQDVGRPLLAKRVASAGSSYWEIRGDDGQFVTNVTEPMTETEALTEARNRLGRNQPTELGSLPKYSKYQLPGGENYREKLLTLPVKSKQMEMRAEADKRGYPDRIADWPDQEFADRYRKEVTNNPDREYYKSSHWDEPNILAHIRMNDRNVEGKPALHIEEIQSDWHQQGREHGYRLSPEATKQFRAIDKKIIDSNDEQVMGQPEIKDAVKLAVNKKIITAKEGEFYIQNSKGAPDFGVIDKELEAKRNDLVNLTEQIRKEHNLPSASEAIKQLLPHEERANLVAKRQELYESDQRYNSLLDEVKSLEDERARGAGAIPDAPFKKTWLELAAKRMIREAAEQGKDVLSWTPGEAQAARYDLSKSIKRIELTDNSSGGIGRPKMEGPFQGGMLHAYDHNGKEVIGKYINNQNELAEHIGKEAAEKLMNVKPTEERSSGFGVRSRKLVDQDLKVGGEGMHYFYDTMLPKVLEKLTGQKMKNTLIQSNPKGWHITPPTQTVSGKWMVKSRDYNSKGYHFNTEEEAKANLQQQIDGERAGNHKINYIDLPQSVKDTALHKGFPLFSSGIMLTPTDDNPFKKYKLTPVEGNPFEEKK